MGNGSKISDTVMVIVNTKKVFAIKDFGMKVFDGDKAVCLTAMGMYVMVFRK